ncbi:hypothetical protein ES703_77540 [subsurface metagenome]
MRQRHGLDPDRLPNARRGRVHEAFGNDLLFAARLEPLVAGVPHAHDDLLRPRGLQHAGDIDGKRIVTTTVVRCLFAVDPDSCFPINGPEMQQEALARPLPGHIKPAAVPEHVRLDYLLLNTRQG